MLLILQRCFLAPRELLRSLTKDPVSSKESYILLQRNQPGSYRKRTKNVLIKRRYLGKIKEIWHYSAVDT